MQLTDVLRIKVCETIRFLTLAFFYWLCYEGCIPQSEGF